MSTQCYTCQLCSFQVPAKPLLLTHLRLAHSNDPRFSVRCGIDGCCYTAKKFSSLYSHVYRKHRDSGHITRQYATDYTIHAGVSHVVDESDVGEAEGSDVMAAEVATEHDSEFDFHSTVPCELVFLIRH